MGIKYSFADNALYGADDVNEIAECLTGAGIMPFLTKDSYSTSDLNAVTAALVTDGVNLGGCSCTAENAGSAEMSVNVAQGIIFFECGVRLMVDSEGYRLEVPPNTEGYVFAHYSPSLQKADIVFDTQLPADGEYVELAKVNSDSSVQCVRRFARSKVGTMGKNARLEVTLTEQAPELCGELGEYYSGFYPYIVAKAKGVDLSKYNVAYIEQRYINADATYIFGLFDIEAEGFCAIGICDDYAQADDSAASGYFSYIASTVEGSRYFVVRDGELCLLVNAESERYAKMKFTYTVKFF